MIGLHAELETRPRVVLIDPRPERRALMRVVVETGERGGIVVAEAATAKGAIGALDDSDVDAAVVEIQMPVAEGLKTIAALRTDHPSLVIVVCSFHDDASTRREAFVAGADGYLSKPVSPRDLQAACRTTAKDRPIGHVDGNVPGALTPR